LLHQVCLRQKQPNLYALYAQAHFAQTNWIISVVFIALSLVSLSFSRDSFVSLFLVIVLVLVLVLVNRSSMLTKYFNCNSTKVFPVVNSPLFFRLRTTLAENSSSPSEYNSNHLPWHTVHVHEDPPSAGFWPVYSGIATPCVTGPKIKMFCNVSTWVNSENHKRCLKGYPD
jgi:fatty-acid desaturase